MSTVIRLNIAVISAGLALAAWGIAVIRAEMARWRRDDNHT